MKVPTLDLKKQYDSMRDEIDQALQEILDNTAFVLGDAVEEFEASFARYCGVNHCIGVNSGTAALTLIYHALDLNDGDEVITSPFTFIATVEPLIHLGARPVFADIDPETYNLDPQRVEDRITPRTRALVPVHLYGQSADMGPFRELADQYDLHLIEDASQAHGARYRDQPVGGIGDVAAFSFYPGKNLGAFGDAGAVTTGDPQLAESIRKLRDHGRESKYSHALCGYNERMDGIQGAVLNVKLSHLDEENKGRRGHAAFYNRQLEDIPVETPIVADERTHVYHQYAIRTPDRDRVLEGLHEADIGAGVHYPIPLHLQPSLSMLDYEPGDFPRSEQAAREVLSLPVFSGLTSEQLEYVVTQLTQQVQAVSPTS